MLDRTQQPPIQELSKINMLPIIRTVLPNGIPLSVIDSEEQSVVRMDIMFGGGYWTQNQKLQAYFTNAMLREGNRKYSSAQIAEKFDYYGSLLDLSVLPQYSYITTYSLNKYFDRTTELVDTMIKEPLFPEKEFNVLASRELQKFRINSEQVKYITARNFRTAIYGEHHPMGKKTKEKDFGLLNTDILREYYKLHYNSDNCHIVLSGKVTDRILAETEKIFGTEPFGMTRKKVIFLSYPTETVTEKRIFNEKSDATQSSVKIGMKTIDQKHPDFHKFNVLITIFGGYFGSRLMSNIRENKGYTYGIYAGFSHEPDSSLLVITSETSNEYVEPLIREVYYEIDRLQNELIDKKELDIVRNYMAGALCRNMELSFSAADVYQLQFINGLEDNYQEEELQAIRSVTPEELRSLACRYLCKENLKEVISGKKSL